MNDFSFWVCWQQSGNGLRHTRRPSSSDNHEQNEQLDYYSYFGGWLKGKTNPDYGNCDENFIHNINCVNAAWLFIICVLLHHYTVFFVFFFLRRGNFFDVYEGKTCTHIAFLWWIQFYFHRRYSFFSSFFFHSKLSQDEITPSQSAGVPICITSI